MLWSTNRLCLSIDLSRAFFLRSLSSRYLSSRSSASSKLLLREFSLCLMLIRTFSFIWVALSFWSWHLASCAFRYRARLSSLCLETYSGARFLVWYWGSAILTSVWKMGPLCKLSLCENSLPGGLDIASLILRRYSVLLQNDIALTESLPSVVPEVQFHNLWQAKMLKVFNRPRGG